MNIAVVGTGYVGLTTGVCFADLGNTVNCIEINPEKLALLRSGKSPIFEPGVEELQERNMRAGRLRFTDDYTVGLADARLIFITVGTPMGDDGAADLTYVKAAALGIGQHLTRDAIIIDKSTVPIGTGDMVFDIITEQFVGQQLLPGTHPVDVAAQRVDLAVVDEVAVGVCPLPARECVGAEPRVHDAQG